LEKYTLEDLDDYTLEAWKKSELGRLKIKYVQTFESEPLGLWVCCGPNTSAYDHDLVKIHQECLRQHKTWEELLDYTPPYPSTDRIE